MHILIAMFMIPSFIVCISLAHDTFSLCTKYYFKPMILSCHVLVRKKIGPFAQPDFVQDAPGLPKTRSGKIMRRVLRKIAVNDHDLGDVSTMADETVVDVLFNLRPKDS